MTKSERRITLIGDAMEALERKGISYQLLHSAGRAGDLAVGFDEAGYGRNLHLWGCGSCGVCI
jgi:hypothetical protein